MLTIIRGRTFSFDATIYDTYVAEGDPGNVPTNHTGWTIRSQIRKKIGNVLVANLNVTFPVPTAGTVAIRHDRVFTRSLPVGDYWWDIVATDASGNDHVYVEPEPIAVHDHPTDPANAVYDFVPGGGGAVYHTHSISDITGLQALLDDRLPPDGGTIARYLRGDNTWQLLNKSAVGLSLVENVTLSTWIGSSNITRLGTIVSGSWQGSRIAPAYLGDGTSIETKFLRGDGTWQTVSGGGGAYIDLSDATTVNLPSVNTPLSSALAGKAATSHTHLSAAITDATSSPTANKLVLRDGTGGADFAGTVNMAIGIISEIRFEDYQAAAGATFTYNDAAAASAHRFALNGGAATGDALFQAATPAAARETALNEILKYDPNAAASRTNPSTPANDDTLVGINLTAGMWEFDFSFSFDAGLCGVAPRFLFGTSASVDLIDSRVIGGVFRADQALASLVFRTPTGTITPAGNGASTNIRYSGFWTMNITGNTTLDMQFARNADSAGTTIIRRAGAFLRARKING